HLRDGLLVALHELAVCEEHAASLGQGGFAPRLERLLRGGDGAVYIPARGIDDLRRLLAGGGIVHVPLAIPPVHGLVIDPVVDDAQAKAVSKPPVLTHPGLPTRIGYFFGAGVTLPCCVFFAPGEPPPLFCLASSMRSCAVRAKGPLGANRR